MTMSARISSPSADGQSKSSFGGRLLRIIMAGRQRQADRRMDTMFPTAASYRDSFGMEMDRRLLGQ